MVMIQIIEHNKNFSHIFKERRSMKDIHVVASLLQ